MIAKPSTATAKVTPSFSRARPMTPVPNHSQGGKTARCPALLATPGQLRTRRAVRHAIPCSLPRLRQQDRSHRTICAGSTRQQEGCRWPTVGHVQHQHLQSVGHYTRTRTRLRVLVSQGPPGAGIPPGVHGHRGDPAHNLARQHPCGRSGPTTGAMDVAQLAPHHPYPHMWSPPHTHTPTHTHTHTRALPHT